MELHSNRLHYSGIYCLLSVAYLLNLLTPQLVAGTAAFVASCQTYEGGFSSASQPYFSNANPSPSSLLKSPRPALGEAHGGYAFCALASWVMLQPFLSANSDTKINLKKLTRWLVSLQGGPSEIGGLKGRTNKLVDGCYSWWVGGSFALLGALGVGRGFHLNSESKLAENEPNEAKEDGWDDTDGADYVYLR